MGNYHRTGEGCPAPTRRWSSRGRNLSIRENCSSCHSQQIRSLRDEVTRYGHYSLAAESKYDHPFLWGSKRIGPDLARVGGKYSDEWHTAHLTDPRSVVPESIMPKYGFMMKNAAGRFFGDIKEHLQSAAYGGCSLLRQNDRGGL